MCGLKIRRAALGGFVRLMQRLNVRALSTPLQVSQQAEEERLGVDFGDIWAKRQKADIVAAVQPLLTPADGTKEITFASEYATSYAYSHAFLTRPSLLSVCYTRLVSCTRLQPARFMRCHVSDVPPCAGG